MTVKQMIRKLNQNARVFVDTGELDKAMAAAECAAMLQRDYSHVKGRVDWF